MLGLRRKSKQEQIALGNSSPMQAGRDLIQINSGLNLEDAKNLFITLFEQNFLRLSEESHKVATERATELIQEYFDRASDELSDTSELSSPDMQYAIINAQKAYARTGDAELGDMLVDILLERSKITQRSLLQVTLNEALEVAPRLSPKQIDSLSLCFLVTLTKRVGIKSLSQLMPFLINDIRPFISTVVTSESSYSHLVYSGCGIINNTGGLRSVRQMLLHDYPLILSTGFDDQFIEDNIVDLARGINLQTLLSLKDVVPHPFYSDKHVFNFENTDDLKLCLSSRYKYSVDKIELLVGQANIMSNDADIDNFILGFPELKRLNELLELSPVGRFSLTSVGIALAHANIRTKTDNNYDINIWIKED